MIWCEGGEGMGGMVVAGLGGGEGGERECILGYETSSLTVVRGVEGVGSGRDELPHTCPNLYTNLQNMTGFGLIFFSKLPKQYI